MLFNSITFEKLSFFLQYYKDPIKGIPAESGIYYWVYWPDFDPITTNPILLDKLLLEYSKKTLFFKEVVKGPYKFEAEIREQGYRDNGNLFGLSPSKTKKLINYFNTQANRIFFHEFFKEVCFTRPFYVGKAKDLQNRLGSQHFKRTTEILDEIDKAVINYSDIWVGYKKIFDPNNDEINTIFEEIMSRKVKPGFTKKPN